MRPPTIAYPMSNNSSRCSGLGSNQGEMRGGTLDMHRVELPDDPNHTVILGLFLFST